MPSRPRPSSMDPDRTRTRAAGLFYIATFLFSIPALVFYGDAIDDPAWVLGAGSDGGVLWGGLFEVLTGLTGIGTAVAVYPIISRHGPGRAAGFVGSRVLEAAIITVGVLAMLALATIRQDLALSLIHILDRPLSGRELGPRRRVGIRPFTGAR